MKSTGFIRAARATNLIGAVLLIVLWDFAFAIQARAQQTISAQAGFTAPPGPVGFADLVFEGGLERLDEGNLTDAVDYFQMAVNGRPGFAPYREALADSYLSLGGEEAASLAMQEYKAVLGLDPGHVGAQEELAQSALMMGMPGLAVSTLESLAGSGGVIQTQYLVDLTSVYLMADQPERGIAFLSAKMPQSQAAPPVRLMMATLAARAGDTGKALALVEQVLSEVPPDDPLAAQAEDLREL